MTAGLCAGVREVADQAGCSSIHWLFCTAEEQARLGRLGFMPRASFQFHWHNRGWSSWDAFLGALASRKRKQLRKERARVQAVIDGVREYEADLSVRAFLFAKFGPVRSKRIYEKYGREARAIIGKNPYRLVTDFEGIGFALADSFASEVGMTDDHPQRLRAGVFAVLQTAAQRGHTCMTAAACIAAVETLLGAAEGQLHRKHVPGARRHFTI